MPEKGREKPEKRALLPFCAHPFMLDGRIVVSVLADMNAQ